MAYHPFRHLGLKVLAIALATLLWLTVAGEDVVERAMRVPLEIREKPEHLAIVGEPPSSVDVLVRGSSAVLSRLDPGDVVVGVDLAGARPGARLFHLAPDQVKVPFGVEVAQVVPGTLSLELEKSARRTVPVKPAVEGEPAAGFIVGSISSEPANVEISGPESRVKQLTEATTEPVSVEGQSKSLRDVVTVGVADSAVRLALPRSATVTIQIVPAPVERDVDGVAIRWRNLARGLRARVEPALGRVRVRGVADRLDSVKAGSVEAFVDLAGLGPGRYNLRVQIEPSQNYGVSSISPAMVQVVVR